MDPITLGLLIGGGTSFIKNIFQSAASSEELNAINNIKQQYEDRAKLQVELLDKQIEQAKQQAALQIQQRKVQGLKSYGGLQAWAAASGIAGGSSSRLLVAEQNKTSTALNVIDTNLQNYLAQATVQKQLIEQEKQAQINTLNTQMPDNSFDFLNFAKTVAGGVLTFTSNPSLGVPLMFS